jgi:hypothetical protein
MYSETKHRLEDFDNQHDFERMAADILNALGYGNVEPMAPGGGSDAGCDIRFNDGDESGMAFVTLDKKIKGKFELDLSKHNNGEGLIALFCNVNVSPSAKRDLTAAAFAKDYRLEVFDLERLRSLLDASLRLIRRHYLNIDDEVASRLRSEVNKLLRFPAAVPDPDTGSVTIIEQHLSDQLPRRLFDLLMQYPENDIKEVPGIGEALHAHLENYYRFRTEAVGIQDKVVTAIGTRVGVAFRRAWEIHFRYVFMRFGGMSPEAIKAAGDFLNFGITWESAEKLFSDISADAELSNELRGLIEMLPQLQSELAVLRG